MQKTCKNKYSKQRVFKKYLARYLLIVLLVVFCCIPFGVNAYNKIKEYAIVISVRQLEDGIRQLDGDVEKMQMIASILGKESCFLELQRIDGEIPMEKYLYLKDVKDRLAEISYIYDFPATIFCVFRNNKIFVSNNQVSEDLSEYYSKFVNMEDLDWKAFQNVFFNQINESDYLFTKNYTYYETDLNGIVTLENAVLYLQPVGRENYWSSPKSVIAFAIDQKKILELLLPNDMQGKAIMLIRDQAGQEVMAYGRDIEALRISEEMTHVKAEGQTYQVFHYDNLPSGLEIKVGFPMNSILDQVYEIASMLFVYILCGSAAAVLLTIICTLYWYKPFGKMLDEVSRLSGKDVERNNEYDYVRESLLKLVSDKDEMETKMLLVNAEKQAVMLEKVFISGFSELELKEWFVQQFPFTQNGYFMVRILITQLQKEVDTQLCLLYATEIFEKEGEYHFVKMYPRNNMVVFLVADEGEKGVNRLRTVLETVCDMVTSSYAVRFIAGISQRQDDIDKINAAYAQARQTVNVYKEKNCSYVEMYQTIYNAEKNCFHLESLQKLYDFVISGNRKGIESSFTEMKQESRNNYEKYGFQKYEIYYSVSFILESVCQQKSLTGELHVYTNEELQNMTLIQCLDDLERNAYRVCEDIEQHKSTKNNAIRKRLLEYMQCNYGRAELTVDLVARELDISEKYVYSIIKEETGNTFSVYLDELRVKYAKECLEKTDWSNEIIAEKAGFGAVNSFYRVFRKYTGLSPGTYRKGKIGS